MKWHFYEEEGEERGSHPHPFDKLRAGSILSQDGRGEKKGGGCEVLRKVYNIVYASRDAYILALRPKIED